MAPKRSRKSKDGPVQGIKRRKVDSSTSEDAGVSAKEIVGIDQLDWKTVTLPDRLDDAEGFYALEEIEGVDIIMPSGNGELKFKAPKTKIKGILKTPTVRHDDSAEDFEEWGGFGDEGEDEDEKSANVPIEKNPPNEPHKRMQEKQPKNNKINPESTNKKPKEQTSRKKQDNGVESGISFSALDDEIEEDVDVSAWDSLGLRPELLTGLARLKFSAPTPIQSACIPQVLEGHDVIGKASTGSGKTLAFGIPILQHYSKLYSSGQAPAVPVKNSTSEKAPLALILSPTRELAHQINEHFTGLISRAPNIAARVAPVTGGLSVHKQQRLLADADIIIATPGRLWEIASSTPGFLTKLKKIKFLVIDEADRLLSEGHFKEAEELISAIDKLEISEGSYEERQESEQDTNETSGKRQTLVFSATFNKGLQQKLSGKARYSHDDLLDKKESMEYLLRRLNFKEERPKFIDVNPISQMAENLKEGLVQCAPMDKDLYLYTLLLYHPKHRTLVFTNSISAVRRISHFLQNLNLPAFALHSSMAQKARLRSVERFSSPSSDPSSILVATDVAARGLDIKGIDLIIHYHVPRTADTYVHRSGRTARATASGKSILICSPEETTGVARLVAKIHSRKNGSVSDQQKDEKKVPIQSIDVDRRIVDRIRPRVVLAKRITDSVIAKEKLSSEEEWLRSAAEDLGVEYDSDDFAEEQNKGKAKGRGRGGGRQAREQKAASLSKAELAGLRAQLRDLLSKKVNVGISVRYLTGGNVDVDELIKGGGNDAFLGHVEKLSF